MEKGVQGLGGKNPPPANQGCLGLVGGKALLGDDFDLMEDVGIVVEQGKIVGCIPAKEITAKFPKAKVIDCSNYLIIPGLINAHSHASLSFFRGLSHQADYVPSDTPARSMIEDYFFPTESNLTPALVESLAVSYLYDGLRAGVTCFGDHYYHIEGVAKALNRFGLRGVVGQVIADLGGALPAPGWDSYRKLLENWPHGERVKPILCPHAADTVSKALLTDVANYSRQYKVPLHMHLSQTQGERERVLKREKQTPVAFAQSCGALTPNSLVVHLVTADEQDLKILAKEKVTIGFCPASQIIFEKLAPLRQFLDLRIPLAVATDCAASNDSADVLAEIRIAALLAKHHGKTLTAKELFQMLTLNPAKVFGLDQRIGSIKQGKAADLVFVKCDLISDFSEHALNHLIHAVGSRNVQHVMIDGKWVLWNQTLPHLSEQNLQDEFIEATREILKYVK